VNGTITGEAPNFTYTPNSNYNGVETFTYQVNDGALDSNIATVTITVTPVSDEPIANNVDLTTSEDTAVAVALSGTDLDGDTLAYSILTQPANGTITGEAPNLTYTPNSNYNGVETFTYQVNDGALDSTVAIVTITVEPSNDAPIASDQNLTTPEDTALSIVLTGSDPEGSEVSYIIVSQPTNGILSGDAPNVIYTPATSYNGPDSFTYKVNDGELDSDVVTVAITVTSVNDSPVAQSLVFSMNELTALAIDLQGSDPDGDALTYNIVSQPGNGTLTGGLDKYNYSPTFGFYGVDTFTYTVTDTTGSVSNIATVTITVVDVDSAPIAVDQSYSTFEDRAMDFILPAFEPEQQAITYTLLTQPSNGVITGDVPNLKYTPNENYTGPDSLTFQVNDGTQDSEIATISITVVPLNDDPDAEDVIANTEVNTPVQVTLVANDIDGDILTFEVLDEPQKGTLTYTNDFSEANPRFTYTPNDGARGGEELTYQVSDGNGGVAQAKIQIQIGPEIVNQAPIVDAGEDIEIDINIERGENLLGGYEEQALSDWDITEGTWNDYNLASNNEFVIFGDSAFAATNAADATLERIIDLSEYRTSIDSGIQQFDIIAFTKSKLESGKPDEGSVTVIFLDTEEQILEEKSQSAPPQSDSWSIITVSEQIPVNTDKVKIILSSEYTDFDGRNDLLFTGLGAYTYPLQPVLLDGNITDDGLPDDSITHEWTQLSGTSIFSEHRDNYDLVFYPILSSGVYEFELMSSDGDLEDKDTVRVIASNDEGSIPIVNAGDDVEEHYEAKLHTLTGNVTVDGLIDDSLIISWSFVDGPSVPSIINPQNMTTEISFSEPGEYTIRLTAFNGVNVVFDDVQFNLTCPTIPDLDLMIMIDHSASMGSINRLNSKMYAAREALLQLLTKPDYTKVRVGLGRLDLVREPLSNDSNRIFDLANSPTAFQEGTGDGGVSDSDNAIRLAVDEINLSGRSNVPKAIIVLTDGEPFGGITYTGADTARAAGIRVLTLGFGSGVNEDYLTRLATLPSDYRFISTNEDIDSVFAKLTRSICLNNAPLVFAGSDQIVSSEVREVQLTGNFNDDNLPTTQDFTVNWRLVSGPSDVNIEFPNELNTRVLLGVEGEYEFELKVNDGDRDGVDTIKIVHSTDECTRYLASSNTELLWAFDHSLMDNIRGLEPAVFSNVNLVDGQIDQGLSFGIESYLTLPSISSSDRGMLEFWFKPIADGYLMNIGGVFKEGLLINDGKLEIGTSSRELIGNIIYNEWYQVILTQNEVNKLSIFVNGELKKEISNFQDISGEINFGNLFSVESTTSAEFILDNVIRYNDTYSVEEISSSFRSDYCVFVLNDNLPPLVNSGSSIIINTIDEVAHLREATVVDDSEVRSIRWSKHTGPGSVSFSDQNILRPDVSFDQAGVYTLKLTARDELYERSDFIEVHVAIGCETPLLSGATHWWTFNGHPGDLIGEANGFWYGAESYQEGLVGNSYDAQDTLDIIEVEKMSIID